MYLYLGRAFAESADERHATEAFVTALKLDRSLQLPAESPPKVLEWWSKAGGAPPAAPRPLEVAPAPTPEPAPTPKPAEPPAPTPTPPPVEARPPQLPAPTPAVEPLPPTQPPAVDTTTRSGMHWWLVPAGAAVVATALAVVFVNQSGSDYLQLTTAPHLSSSDGASLASQGQNFQTAGWSLAGVALAAAAIAFIVLLLVDR